MLRDEMWNIFKSTGKIDAYLCYKQSSNINKYKTDNNKKMNKVENNKVI